MWQVNFSNGMCMEFYPALTAPEFALAAAWGTLRAAFTDSPPACVTYAGEALPSACTLPLTLWSFFGAPELVC